MRKLNNQLGAGKFGLFIFTIIIILVIYALVKYLPVKLNSYELLDTMERLARNAAYNEEMIKKELISKARELNIPLSESQIKVRTYSERCDIEVDYQITIETPFMTKTLPFNLKVSEKRII